MTLTEVLVWSVGRTLLVSTVAVFLAGRLVQTMDLVASVTLRRAWLAAILLPLFVPDLIVGFSWRLTAQHLTNSMWGTECLYAAVLLTRACGAAVLVLMLVPQSAVTAESLHSWRLLNGTGGSQRHLYRLLLMGPWRGPVVAWCLTALVAFQDFETAAMIQVDRHPVVWTVWMFDAHAGNQMLTYTLKLMIAPVVIQVVLLAPAMGLLLASAGDGGGKTRLEDYGKGGARRTSGMKLKAVLLILTVVGVTIVVGWPVFVSVPEVLPGMPLLVDDVGSVFHQQLTTIGFSLAAAILSTCGAVLLHRSEHPLLTAACLLPGMAGSLVLSLLLLQTFQLPGLRMIWDSWLPLLAGQSLLMLPRAWILVLVLDRFVSRESLHSARLMAAVPGYTRFMVPLLWRLVHVRWIAVCAILCHWCTWDVTTGAVLRPVTIEPVVTRLYREMHFSRTESLTALTLVTLLMPFFSTLLAAVAWRVSHGFGRVRSSGFPGSKSPATDD